MAERQRQLREWLERTLAQADIEVRPASGDASFRRYFRVRAGARSYIAMDAPPAHEDCGPYVQVAELFHGLGLNVPEVLARDLAQGFLLLTDLGDRLFLDELNESTVERLYGDALGALMVIQACGPRDASLPVYDRALLMREMELFRDWFLDRHLSLQLDAVQAGSLARTFERLAQSALEQPQVCVHRDYHSRNLMLTTHNNPGILDFQDAVIGPVTYDLVSLLRDCYVAWPRARVEEWALGYHELAIQSGVLQEEDEAHFLQWFDLMGVQRHLKAIGIFARLNHRDAKPGYLKDIPRTLAYVMEASARRAELRELHDLLESIVTPQMQAAG